MANTEVIELTEKLVGIPSVAGDNDSMYEVLAVAQEELGDFTSLNFAPAPGPGTSGPSALFFNQHDHSQGFRVLLHGHLDVVAAQDEEQFKPKRDGSRLYGRGAYDMKAAAAALISVFREVGHSLPYACGLSLTTDEETSGNGAAKQIENGVKSDFVLSGEPTDLEIGNQHKGLLTVGLSAKTQGGHTAYDGEPSNALSQIIRVQSASMDQFPSPDGAWHTTSSPVSIEVSGNPNNTLPSYAAGRISIRYIPGDDPNEILQKIQNIHPNVDAKKIGSGMPSHRTDHDNQYIRLLSQVLENQTGLPARLRALPHTSDVVRWAAVGSAAVDFGPCGSGMHSDREYVDIPSLHRYRSIIEDYLGQLATVG